MILKPFLLRKLPQNPLLLPMQPLMPLHKTLLLPQIRVKKPPKLLMLLKNLLSPFRTLNL